MSKMNPEVKASWVAALRSGEYKQGQKRLRSRDGAQMCCLGVLCDVIDPAGWTEDERFGIGHARCIDTPPEHVRDAAGWPRDEEGRTETPLVTIRGTEMYLWQHNDCGRTFAEIADAIESQL